MGAVLNVLGWLVFTMLSPSEWQASFANPNINIVTFNPLCFECF